MGEFLYSKRGAQSAGISHFFMDKLNLNPNNYNSTFLYEIFSKKWGDRYFEVRPGMGLLVFGGSYVKDRMLDSAHETLVSVPLYCKLAGISVSEVEFETVSFRLKPEYNEIDFLN